MGFDNNPDSNGQAFDQDQDVALDGSVSSVVETGSGGDTLSLFGLSRTDKLKKWDPGKITNESSFGAPKGFADSANRPFDHGIQNGGGGVPLGIGATIQATDYRGAPVSGQVTVDLDDQTLGGGTGSGTLIVAASPPDGVASGANSGLSSTSMTISFNPTEVDGVPFEASTTYPGGGTFSTGYGLVFGRVTDANGDLVPSTVVSSGGVGASTDTKGIYELYAPTGNSIDVKGLKNTESKSVTPSDRLTELDWQFAGIEAKITGPNGIPVENAPVQIDGTNYRTDETGKVVEPLLGLGDHTVTLLDSKEQTVTLTFEGELNRVTESTGAKLEISCYDAQTGQAIRDLPVLDETTGRKTFTNTDGKASLLTTGGDQKIVVAKNDPRYTVDSFEETVQDGNVKQVTVELDQNIPTINS